MVDENTVDNNEPMSAAALERDADSKVDMWCSVGLVLLAWGIAIFWVSGQ